MVSTVQTFPAGLRAAAAGVLLIALVLSPEPVLAQPAHFPLTIPYGFPALSQPSLRFSDFEGDGDLDLVVTGSTPERTVLEAYILVDHQICDSPNCFDPYSVKLYRPLNLRAHAVSLGAVRLFDYDSDSDMDLLITGLADYVTERTHVVEPILEIHENDWPPASSLTGYSSPFVRRIELPGLYRSAADWADFDGDGDLDFIAAGLPEIDGREPVTRLYRNDDLSFTEVESDFPGVMSGDVAWGDFDEDGDPDLAIMGDTNGGTYLTRVYRNEGTHFVDIGLDAPGLAHGSIDWGDFDDDGDLDLLVAGMRFDPRFLVGETRIYRNESGALVESGIKLPGLGLGEARWGDADRDGDLDLFIVGSPEALEPPAFQLLSFTGSDYVETWSFTGNRFAALDVGDYNGDGDADVIVAGELPNGFQIRFLMNWDVQECAVMWIEEGYPGDC